MVTNLRQDVAAALTPVLPAKWKTLPYADDIGNPTQPVVMVRQQSVSRGPVLGTWHNTFEVVLTVPQTDPAKADDVLDDALEDLIYAIEDIDFPGLIWTGAERGVVGNLPAYSVSLSITTARKEN